MVTSLVSGLFSRLGDAAETLTQPLTTPTVRLGVTGLSRAGKTVFITSLIHNLMRANRMLQFEVISSDRFVAAMIEAQPDPEFARFAFETNIDGLMEAKPVWPESTNRISQIRISIRYKPQAFLKRTMNEYATLNIDIIDFPGEWLLDLPMMEMDFETWSRQTIEAAKTGQRATMSGDWLKLLGECDPAAPCDERLTIRLFEAYRDYLLACKYDGSHLNILQPGRFIQPGDMEGSPALTFCPMLKPEGPDDDLGRNSLYGELERRFDHYKAKVITPFFRNHFAKLNRQIVLVDMLGAADAGLEAIEELESAVGLIQSCLRPGASSWIEEILFGRRIEKVLYAATKADHLNSDQHSDLVSLVRDLTLDASTSAAFKGANTDFMALASLRSTSEVDIKEGRKTYRCIKGILSATGKAEAIHPGDLPANLAKLKQDLKARESDTGDLKDPGFEIYNFDPPKTLADTDSSGEMGLPHIRLDKAMQFLVGDLLE